MPGGSFADTNLFVYFIDNADAIKQRQSEDLLREVRDSGNGVVSYQVWQEFVNILLRGSLRNSRPEQLISTVDKAFLGFHMVWPSYEFFNEGIRIQARYKFHWYDSLIVAAALEAKCDLIYTEDLQHGQRIEGLTVVNPFL